MTSIFVAKLDFNATEEQVKSLFEQYGKVNRITIAKDKETGKPRGFAFVEMFNENEAEAAISALDNYNINGRSIAVKKADDRGNNNNSRPANQEKRPFQPRNDQRRDDSGFKADFKKPEERPERTNFVPQDQPAPVKPDRKKEKENRGQKDAPKKTKMEAYKKSGKSNRFMDDDEDDDFDMNYYRNRRSSGWDDDEEE